MKSAVVEQNLADFQDEWVFLCASSRRLEGMKVRVDGTCEVLKKALNRVLAAHGATICEQNYTHRVFLNAPMAEDRTSKVLCVFAGQKQKLSPDGRMLLYLPALYGAGLPKEYDRNADDASSIHVADALASIVSALSEFSVGEKTVSAPGENALVSRQEGLRCLRILQQFPERRFYDDSAYGGNLRALQQLQLKLLLELDRICRENGISYFLGGGTLLGAVRHQGFIPWDDDVDVMMSRENFDRFASIAPKAAKEGFFFQNSTTDPNYHSPFHKLRAKGTLFVTEFSQRFEMQQGVFLDIFAHDAAPKNKKLLKAHIFMTTLARSMVFHKWDDSAMHFYGRKKLFCRIATFFVRHSSMRRLEKIERRVMTFYNKRNTGVLYDSMGEHLQHGGFDADILQETTTALFEGYRFPVPKNFDAYLRFSYGDDYITLPRPSLRCVHHTAVRFSLGEEKNHHE